MPDVAPAVLFALLCDLFLLPLLLMSTSRNRGAMSPLTTFG